MKKEVVENLHKAIDLATNPNACAYLTVEGQPCCVAGQFAFLSGIPIETLKSWEGLVVSSHQVKKDLIVAGVDEPTIRILRSLQIDWDASEVNRAGTEEFYLPTEEERRAKMHAIVKLASCEAVPQSEE